jgi:hypothetical protein
MKEFLTAHNVDFVSVNVLEDREGLEELVALAGRQVPIARRGNGLGRRASARRPRAHRRHFVGGATMLAPPELATAPRQCLQRRNA